MPNSNSTKNKIILMESAGKIIKNSKHRTCLSIMWSIPGEQFRNLSNSPESQKKGAEQRIVDMQPQSCVGTDFF